MPTGRGGDLVGEARGASAFAEEACGRGASPGRHAAVVGPGRRAAAADPWRRMATATSSGSKTHVERTGAGRTSRVRLADGDRGGGPAVTRAGGPVVASSVWCLDSGRGCRAVGLR